ncbi:hypothetical protein HD553DRAFT_149353 [Filobasidium floriforme]|uniref:uncharacterized protein n=1 Tax=Filobasidium floriforme TaxID=5210 RepID=UPI001E8EB8A7|nr:uncharacterized protein HD553DRAFT_149353 [Filobasidium floriforme]KAH8078366.1 hypothetical protein HD553DRAFT_149353 [Filobasidium floriforme]
MADETIRLLRRVLGFFSFLLFGSFLVSSRSFPLRIIQVHPTFGWIANINRECLARSRFFPSPSSSPPSLHERNSPPHRSRLFPSLRNAPYKQND